MFLGNELGSYDCKIVIENNLIEKYKSLLESINFADKNLLIVCDKNTLPIAENIFQCCNAKILVLTGDKPHASLSNVNKIRAEKCDAIIAVGSGTISDLCKYASYLEQKSYAIFPTAPSMNGYLSANASITIDRHKQTLKAHLPKAVFCDLEILANAPARLILSGLGDSLCRSTAQADWLLSHLLLDTYYNPKPFELLAPYEKKLFANSDKLLKRDFGIIELLMKTLLVSGLGMTIAGGSYPASQGEHLIAHTMEMKYKLPPSYHGEQIGVTTLIMAQLQEKLLANKLPLVKSIGKPKYHKFCLYQQANERISKHDYEIRKTIKKITLSASYLRKTLEQAGAAISAQDLGWQHDELKQAISDSYLFRDRFTFLDLSSDYNEINQQDKRQEL